MLLVFKSPILPKVIQASRINKVYNMQPLVSIAFVIGLQSNNKIT